ncbi:MAG: Grx4 family monothiol glutaredoxin [Halobacteriovoraceae bacterium]|nr:Grx4 family monothiol glutaredoxin [Halobacteriovoraceae bacterium]MCB9094079.1 Grx4 family monothiol glutaredoxin [Halobacteriovoraceae bacterium]
MSENNNPFNVVNPNVSEEHAQKVSNEIPTGFEESDTLKRIEKIIQASPIVIFMKGNAFFPQCGFSANTVAAFSNLGVEFKTYDILQDPELRQQIKDYSNWPTFPQVYVKGKLIGGNDIVMELYHSGELQQILN